MVDLPKPEQLEGYLGDIEHAVEMVRDGYRWAWPDSHRRPKHASREQVSGGGEHDVSDLVLSTDYYRSKVRSAARAVVEARNVLMRAQVELNDALALLEPPLGPEVADVRLLEHPADKGDVARAREAQERRLGRARSTGDWAEVTGA